MNLAKRLNGMTRDAARAGWRSNVARLPWRPVPFAIGLAVVAAHHRGADVDFAAPNAAAALAKVLQARGLECGPDDVAWTVRPTGVFAPLRLRARALVRASAHNEPSDLYLVEARLSPEGALLEAGATWDLTNTSGVDESLPVLDRAGRFAAYTTEAHDLVTAVHTLDLAGRPSSDFDDFTRVQRTQVALTNLQQTGQATGVVDNEYALEPVGEHVELEWRADGTLGALADRRKIVIDAARGDVVEGAKFVRAVPDERAKPGNVVTWAVDRARAMPWLGDEKMQWVKAIAFTGLDWVNEAFAKSATAKDVEEELGSLNSGQATPTFTDPEIGWPPAPIAPVLSPALPGEGQWIALDKDPFITQTPGAPAAFVTSFVRPNKARPDLRVYVTLWDPRQIALHMESGTVEPVSSTGEHGPGLIPRTPEVMHHVVAAFNGGFQAQHGEYGMEANGIVYLPPKPYAATVMELRDGSTAFGVWPASSPIPEDVLSFRQNLTPLVEFDKYNPWQRTWWGGTPPGWGDNIHSARSAICLTKDNFVGYFWSASISPEDLGAALLAARCAIGIHLDMNPGHAGFEFYNIAPQAIFTPLGRPLQTDWEAEGKVKDMPDWAFRARRMIRGMGHMLFPRYVQREARDFFYLTTRTVLPGPELTGAVTPKEPGEGAWRTKGLPQHGFPYALAVTWVRPDAARADAKMFVLRVDPRTVKPAQASEEADPAIVLSMTGRAKAEPGEVTLWFAGGGFAIGPRAPSSDAAALAPGLTLATTERASSARAAVGINDEDGMLTWVELPPDLSADGTTASRMDGLLAKLGCSSRMLLTDGTRALLGGALDITGNAPSGPPAPSRAVLVRGSPPAAHTMFESTEVVPYSVWQPLQAQRVRYVGGAKPAASGSMVSSKAPH